MLKKHKKKILIGLGVVVGIPLIYVVSVIAIATFSDWQPEGVSEWPLQVSPSSETDIPDTVSFYTWNIGYGGLGSDMDFFYDGGSQVETPPEWHKKYLEGIRNFLITSDSVDFFLFQEVDSSSARTQETDEFMQCSNAIPRFNASFVRNYRVKFVPMPLTDPLGPTWAGLACYSKYKPSKIERHQYPGKLGWPTRLFLLDRCAQVLRYPVGDDKELVVLNTHNTAYDEGEVKAQEMEYLKSFLLSEYQKGNYVIAGGDWNQCPPYFDPGRMGKGPNAECNGFTIDPDYLPPEWTWSYDPLIPTNRKLYEVYNPATTKISWIDFFVVSPNVKILRCHGVDQQFAFSDHQPVFLKVVLQ